jgi:hypothetical protein
LVQNYGISESYAQKTVRRVEDILAKSRVFSLLEKKALKKSDAKYKLVLIDATESPIERQKTE